MVRKRDGRRLGQAGVGSVGLVPAVVALAVIAAPATSLAQLAAGSNSGPIDITADNGTFENATCTSTWSGAAEVLQGDSRLRADQIKAFLKVKPPARGQVPAARPSDDQAAPDAGAGAGCGATERIEADGHVFYVTPSEIARGDHAVYTADDGRIVMTGNVIVVQGKDVIHGDRMTIQVATHQVAFESAAKGRGTPGRVRGVFYPGQPGLPGAGPAPPAPVASG